MADIKGTTPQLVREQFAAVARNYAVSKVHAHGEDLPVLLQLAQLSGRETVLDAGCGPGPVTLQLAPHAGSVTSVDFTPSMLEVAKESAAAQNLTNVRIPAQRFGRFRGRGSFLRPYCVPLFRPSLAGPQKSVAPVQANHNAKRVSLAL